MTRARAQRKVAPVHTAKKSRGEACAERLRPNNNMGLASDPTPVRSFAQSVDYCSMSFPESELERLGLSPDEAVEWLFPGCSLRVSQHELRTWQFYPMSSYIYGPDGSLVGRVGSGGNRGTACVSLSGAGCALVTDWMCTRIQAGRLRAHITRLDVAFDDFESNIFPDIRTVNGWALEGRFNVRGRGKACSTRFMDDHNKGKGSTLYIGSRGAKQLCVYEKGKQLGDPQSKWIRCELRLWSNDCIVPLDALVKPGRYLRGGYALLAELLPAVDEETAKPERLARAVKATAEASIQFLRQQCGPTLDLLIRSVGPDVWTLLHDRVLRSSVPRRFRGMARNLPELRNIVRQQLCLPTVLAV